MRPFAFMPLIPLLAGFSQARAAEEVAPTFTKDIAPIIFAECSSCHRPGQGTPFSLLNYQDVKKHGKVIAQVTDSKMMPPWKADKGDVAFKNERRLNDEQIALLQKWVETGMPEGDPAKLPTPPTFADTWTLGKPDLVVKMPKAYKVAAEGHDIYRNFAISLGLTEDKWVRAIDFKPSAPSVLHHTLFFLDMTGTAAKLEAQSGEVGTKGGMGGGVAGKAGGKDRGAGLGALLGGLSGQGGTQTGRVGALGGWAVGAQARALPDGLAYHLPKGSDLILQTHFHPSGKAEEEASTVAFYFADKPPVQRFTGIQVPFGFGIMAGIDIAAGKNDFTIEDSYTLPVDVKAFGVSAHAHYPAKEFKLTAKLPDGKTKTLLSISDWDFSWQEQYAFKDFVDLPKGTKLSVKITYDNSAANPHNPTSPPKRVRWGKESTDEMGSITLQVVAAREDEYPKLTKNYMEYVREEAIKKFNNRQ